MAWREKAMLTMRRKRNAKEQVNCHRFNSHHIYENDIYRLQTSQTEVISEIVKKQYYLSLNQQLLTVEEQIRAYKDELATQKLLLDKMTIRASTTGYILSSAASYEGQVIAGFQELFVIIPDGTSYIFEGYISDKDIADISIGDIVQIKLHAYSFSDYGIIEGKVSYISPSSTNIEGLSNVYSMSVEIEEKCLNGNIELRSGMSGTMEIKVGKRSVLEYFLEPIVGNLNNSLKEN